MQFLILCQTAYLYLGSTSLPAYYVPDARIQAEKWLEQVFFPNVFGIFAIFYNVLCLQIPSYTGKNCQKRSFLNLWSTHLAWNSQIQTETLIIYFGTRICHYLVSASARFTILQNMTFFCFLLFRPSMPSTIAKNVDDEKCKTTLMQVLTGWPPKI